MYFERNLLMFNDKENIYGYDYRVLIGSRVIQEGVNFNCIRFMYSLSLPRDISTLIQLYGRAVRAKSHLMLPTQLRDVTIYNLVSTFKNESSISPELLNYKNKMTVYMQIQLIERELRRYAIDNFINFDKMHLPDKPTLDGLPYEPAFKFSKARIKDEPDVTTFEAYGYGTNEVEVIIRYLKRLFMYRPVWTQKDLWNQVRHPSSLYKTQYDHSTFSEANFLLALDFLINGTYIELMEDLDPNYSVTVPYINIGGEMRRVLYQPPYFILTSVDEVGIPVVDYDSFMRINTTEVDTELSINKYVEESITEKNFTNYLKDYVANYKSNPIMSLVKIHQNFHYTVCKYEVEGKSVKGTEGLVELYEELQFLVYADDFHSKETADAYSITEKKKPIGFLSGDMSYIYSLKKWVKIPTTLLNINVREEDEYVIGYTRQTSTDIDFKIRDSLTSKAFKSFKDKRKMQKGIVCTSIKLGRKNRIASELGVNVGSLKNKDICDYILIKLLSNEKRDRAKKGGRRFFYFFFDAQPQL